MHSKRRHEMVVFSVKGKPFSKGFFIIFSINFETFVSVRPNQHEIEANSDRKLDPKTED